MTSRLDIAETCLHVRIDSIMMLKETELAPCPMCTLKRLGSRVSKPSWLAFDPR